MTNMREQSYDAEANAPVPRCVAVLAVHGIGNPEPGETARSIASLLLRLRKSRTEEAAYSSLSEENVTFPAGQVPVGAHGPKPAARKRDRERRRFGWRSEFPSDDISFIREQLSGFKPTEDDTSYESSQIRTVRHDGVKVDIYEVHWSDISRRGKGFFRFFIELYQLLFHLSLLSEKTILAHYFTLGSPSVAWKALRFLTFAASRYLTRLIVLFNLWLIAPALIATCYPLVGGGLTKEGGATAWVACCIGALALSFGALILWRTRTVKSLSATGIISVAVLLILLGLAADYLASNKEGFCGHLLTDSAAKWYVFWESVSAFSLAVVSGTVLTFLFNKYHPNSEWIGALVGGVVASSFAYSVYQYPQIHLFSAFFFLLATLGSVINSLAVMVLEILVVLVGLLALNRKLFKVDDAGTRAFITAILGLAFPTVLISVVTVTAWECLNLATIKLSNTPADHWPEGLLQIGSNGSPVMLGLFAVALLLGVTILLPTVFVEVAVPARRNRSSRFLGVWLTIGGWFVNILTCLLFASAVAPICGQFEALSDIHRGTWTLNKTNMFASLTAVVGGGGILVLALKNIFQGSSPAFLALLERVLDVDEYLRDSPDGYTAKARIFNRYQAVMKGLVEAPPDGVLYDKIIVLAHSQGTVISADYFRFLHRIGSEWQKRIALFTMGCPLRQLYGWRFPSWYDWSWTCPRARDLGVEAWSNAYGAGDGVGRSLWRPPSAPATYDLVMQGKTWEQGIPTGSWSKKPDWAERETCIGNTGHLHYWDTADDFGSEVAMELDRLISAARPLHYL